MDNIKYTLGDMRRTVFRLLDEYSYEGEGTRIFSGGLADIEKRFITALNSAIRLVYLSSLRHPEKKQITLSMPHILTELCDFSLSESTIAKNIVIPESSESVSFDFCGRGEERDRALAGYRVERGDPRPRELRDGGG